MKRVGTNYEDAAKRQKPEGADDNNTSRTVYLGGIPNSASFEVILDNVRGGPIEGVRRLLEKGCVFIDFMDHQGAQAFYQRALRHKMVINGSEVKVGWGKPSELPTNLLMAFQGGATRNVFLGSLDDSFTLESLREDFARYGEIDNIRVIKEKKIAFVHFVNLADALNAVASISSEEKYESRKVNYGKDRCAFVEQPQQQQAGFDYNYYAAYYAAMMDPSRYNELAAPSEPVRTIYLGGLHPETTAEDLCNVIRGGILHNIKVVPEKRCAFVTFVDPNAAYAFYTIAQYQGILVRGHKLKPGLGKSLPLPAQASTALQKGASRNVYIGNVPEDVTLEKLKEDFLQFGAIECVNLIRPKNIAFVNFNNLLSAVKAVDNIKSLNETYRPCKVAYGKDRCGSVDPKTLLAPISELYNQYAYSYYNYQPQTQIQQEHQQ